MNSSTPVSNALVGGDLKHSTGPNLPLSPPLTAGTVLSFRISTSGGK